MPEDVSYDRQENLVIVKSTGILTADEVKTSIREVARYCREKGAKKVYVDQLQAQSFPGDALGFNLGSDVAHLLKGVKIAIVHSGDVEEEVKFFEKVAQIRGGTMRVFAEACSARAWLDS